MRKAPILCSPEGLMWRYSNPVAIAFGVDAVAELPKVIAGQTYALVT